MKYIILVPDGMADRPLRELGGRTPVEAANTPNMDHITRAGVCGMAQTFFEGLPYDSSIANMSILGYDPRKYFCGRSPLEAANLGISLGGGDISLRANLITVGDGKISDFTAGHISSSEGAELIKALNDGLGQDGLRFYPGVSYRNILVLKSNLSPSLDFKATAPHDIVGKKCDEHRVSANSSKAKKTAELINKLVADSCEILADHPVNARRIKGGKNPANSIWLWGAGSKPSMPSFKSMYGIDGSIVSAVDLLKGIGKVIGLDVLDVEGATGYLDTNYEGKADAAVESLSTVDFSYVHVEATDESGHEGNIEHKIQAIEDVDKKVLGRILDRLDGEYRILMMPDHPTPIEVRSHTSEPVPYVIYNSSEKGADSVKSFSEKLIREGGSLPPTEAYKLMKSLIKG